jgi:subtilisin family serine protease
MMCAFALVPGGLMVGAVTRAAAAESRWPYAPTSTGRPITARHAEDHVLVRFRSSTTAARKADVARSANGRIGRPVAGVRGLAHVQLDAGTTVDDAVAALERQPDVVYAEPDYVVSTTAVPNDSRYAEQWGLNNTGQTVEGVAGTADADIDAPEAWDVTTGSASVTVAVLDSGLDYFMPDLAPNVWKNPGEIEFNNLDDDGNGFIDDVHGWDFAKDDNRPDDDIAGHGTHVAGTIGARGNNDAAGPGATDVVGVNWQVSLMPVRVLGDEGSGLVSDIVAGIGYAAQNGARIVNMSFGSTTFSQAEQDAIAAAPNVLFVAAAGNEGYDVSQGSYPCTYPLANIVCVAATDNKDQRAPFSNYGAGVDIAAPGVGILSTYPFEIILEDGIEESPITPRWTTGGTPNSWGRTTEAAAEGVASLTDSPGSFYTANNNNWARRGPIDVSQVHGCRLSYLALIDAYPGDYLHAEFSNNGTSYSTQRSWQGDAFSAYAVADDVYVGGLTSTLYLRFRMTSNATQHGDGVYVDDVALRCWPAAGNEYRRYASFSGTSMAAPHVSGVAALVLARFPTLTVSQLRARVVGSADPVSLGIGGGRLNAFKAVSNAPATVNAGADRSVKTSTPAVTLQGSASDAEGDPVTVLWVQQSGTPVTLDDPTKLQPKFNAPASPTTLQFRITASTPNGPDVTDTVTITVKAPK